MFKNRARDIGLVLEILGRIYARPKNCGNNVSKGSYERIHYPNA
jgi:hypothetical protein